MSLIENLKQWAADRLIGEGEVETKKIVKAFDKIKDSTSIEDGLEKMGISDFEMMQQTEYYYGSIYFNTSDKERMLKEYREMANFPEIADGIDNICEEAIDFDANGEVIKLQVNNEEISDNENMMKNLQGEFEYILDILDIQNNAFNLFKKFYYESELFGEMVINPSNPKEGVKKIVMLAPETIKVDYDKYENITGFKQKVTILDPTRMTQFSLKSANAIAKDKGYIQFNPNQIAYINSGITTKNEAGEKVSISYIDRAKIAYRQLKWMEDAMLIYRIVRAPNRLVFTIDTGNLPKKKAEEYMQTIINRYKTRKVYNTQTGEVDLGKATIAMTENYWFPKRSDGSGPTVTTLQGMAQIGDITDVIYFVKKLYKALKVPTARLDEADKNYFYTERDGEENREEIKFAKYAHRIRIRWIEWVKQIYKTHLKLKGVWQEFGLTDDDIDILFINSNDWREALNMKTRTARLALYADMLQYVDVDFSRTWLKKNILHMSDEELRENEEMIKQDKEHALEMGGTALEPTVSGEEVPSPEGEFTPAAGEEGAPSPEGEFTPAEGEEGAPETEEIKTYKGSMKNIQSRLGKGFARGTKK